MKQLLGLVPLCLTIAGCHKAETAEPVPRPAPPGAAAQGGGGGIAPIGPNVGGITPVTGGQEIGGTTGGGIAQAAKDRARRTANQESNGPEGESETGE